MSGIVDASAYPNFAAILNELLEQWPQHEKYLRINVAEREPPLLAHSERLAAIVTRLGRDKPDGLKTLARDYRFLCQDIVMPEELHFRRHGRYRLTNFEDALNTVYNNKAFMTRYMNGLLVSDVIWINHCRCMMHFAGQYLTSLKPDARILEIGPGHGLLLYLADTVPGIAATTAWDVSDASLELAAHTLEVLGARRPVQFQKRNIFEAAIMDPANEGLFDGVVLSEVLEHLEEPLRAIEVLFHITRPGGKVWINVPANSPAPDHLFLVNELQDAVELVKRAGFDVVEEVAYPMSGVTLDRAVKQKLTVSCIVVGQKPE